MCNPPFTPRSSMKKPSPVCRQKNRKIFRTAAAFARIKIIATFLSFHNQRPRLAFMSLTGNKLNCLPLKIPVWKQSRPIPKPNISCSVKPPHTPPMIPFGAEPAHGWCYFYQKAELARQQGDWDSIAALGAEAASLDLAPADPIEWMPFLQAYAVLGQIEKVESLATQFKDDSFHKEQFCQSLTNEIPLKDEMQSKVDSLFCRP
jgi:hypothetical protein